MCQTEIPYFKEIIVLAFTCDNCGAKSSEVKTGGEVSPIGKRITLNVKSRQDMMRFCFKSETCSMKIPELEFESSYGDAKGIYSTIEGILSSIKDNLEKSFPMPNDSNKAANAKLYIFYKKLEMLQQCKK